MFEKRNQNKIRAKSARTQGIHRFHQFFYLGYGYVFYDDPWIIRTSSMPFFLKAPRGRQPDAKPIQKNLKFNLLTPVEKKDPKKGSCITRKMKIQKSKKWEIEKMENLNIHNSLIFDDLPQFFVSFGFCIEPWIADPNDGRKSGPRRP